MPNKTYKVAIDYRCYKHNPEFFDGVIASAIKHGIKFVCLVPSLDSGISVPNCEMVAHELHDVYENMDMMFVPTKKMLTSVPATGS